MKTMPYVQPNTGSFTFRNNALISLLKPEEMSRGKSSRKYKKGHIIFHEGQRPGSLYWIKEGKVKLFKTGLEGKDQITQLLNSGDILGYRAMLVNEPYSVSAAALEDSLIYRMSESDFTLMLKQDSSLLYKLTKALSRDLKNAEIRMLNLAQKSVRERLADALISLKDIYGCGEDLFLRVSLSREDLASLVGTATETVIRLLSEMKKERVISIQGKKIQLIDLRKLIKAQNAFS